MGLREDAVRRAHRVERERLGTWRSQAYARSMIAAFGRVTGDGDNLNGFAGPLESGLTSLTPEWLSTTAVAEHPDDSLDLLLRYVGDDPPASAEDVEVYAMGECPRCDAKVPLGPPATYDNLGIVLLTGKPVGHDCPALWGQQA